MVEWYSPATDRESVGIPAHRRAPDGQLISFFFTQLWFKSF